MIAEIKLRECHYVGCQECEDCKIRELKDFTDAEKQTLAKLLFDYANHLATRNAESTSDKWENSDNAGVLHLAAGIVGEWK